jgi:hypothetical protein
MFSSVWRYSFGVAIGVFAACFVFVASASAQGKPNSAVEQFLANPSQVLQHYPNGGSRLISLIRDAAVSHPEDLQNIIALLKTANVDQQSAIGSALGQAARIVVRTNQAYANQIQQAVAGSGSDDANTAFAGVTGNVSIASTGGGGGGGGGSGGPTGTFGFAFGGSNSGTPQTFGGQHYQTATQNYFTGGSSGGASNSSGTTRSVSPH